MGQRQSCRFPDSSYRLRGSRDLSIARSGSGRNYRTGMHRGGIARTQGRPRSLVVLHPEFGESETGWGSSGAHLRESLSTS